MTSVISTTRPTASPPAGGLDAFEPLDIAACYGRGFTAHAIRFGTASLLAPPRLRVGPSHVAVLCEFHGRMLWIESTTLCPHPCAILQRHINGCQAHLPEIRIRDYVAAGGHVDLYRLAPIEKLSHNESKLLTRILVRHFIGREVTYDMGGALLSGTRLFKRTRLLPSADLNELFCSELVAAVCMRLGRMNRSNPTRFNPACLLRELVRQGTVYFERTFTRETPLMLMQRCRLSLLLIGLLLMSGVAAFAAERDAVLRVEGCTGFIVEGNLLVTAKHCRHPVTLTVSVRSQAVAARRVYTPDGEDGPVVFRLDGGPHPSLPVAQRKPEPGERVYSLGYPGGNWARVEGELIGGNGVDVNYTNHRIATGNSGGPLLNERGEVIGVALFVSTDVTVHRSGFTGWQTTVDAIRAAQRPADQKPRSSRRPIVVVFSSESCGPCKQLERDVRAGHFKDYEFRFIKWDDARDQWSDPAVYDEFLTQCRPDTKSLGFPTIWVQGTDQYRVGYTTERRGGLLGWLAAAVRHLIQGLIGRDPEPQFPPPETPRVPDVSNIPKVEPAPRSDELLLRLAQDLAALRDEAVKTKSDLEEFKESGVVGKIRTLARLKSDKDDALDRVASVKADVAELRSQFREHPLQFLWGLFGLVSGLIHRRFAA